MFGSTIHYDRVTVRRRKWFPFQPRDRAMAPRGHIHFHPLDPRYRDDFGTASIGLQGFFIHEMAHVWQYQRHGFRYMALKRRPFSRYDYMLLPGLPLQRYGIEQQAEIVRHAFLLRKGVRLAGVIDPSVYDGLVDFPARTRSA